MYFNSTSASDRPPSLEDLGELVDEDRAAGRDRDGAALEIGRLAQLRFQVGTDHQVVGIGTGRARHQQADRQPLAQRIEEAGRERAADDLQPVGREQHRHVARGPAHLELHVDAGLAVITLLQRHIERRAGERGIVAHDDPGRALAEGSGRQDGCEHQRKAQDMHAHRCSPRRLHGAHASALRKVTASTRLPSGSRMKPA